MPRKKKITVNTPQKKKFIPEEQESIPQEKVSIDQEKESVSQEEKSLKLLGEKIRKARIDKNLSLESVSGHLHIAVKILEAIEEGSPEKGPKPVFLRGLVRTYCQYLELDRTKIVDKIDSILKSNSKEEQQLKTLKPVSKIRESRPILNIVVLLFILSGGFLLYSINPYQIFSLLTKDNNTTSESSIVVIENQLTDSEKIIVTDNRISTAPQLVKQIKQEPSASKNFIKQIEAKKNISSVEDSSNVKTFTNGGNNAPSDVFSNKTKEDEDDTEKDKISESLDFEKGLSLTARNQTNLYKSAESEVEQDFLEPLTLEVEASEGTWISISVDGNESKDIRISTDEIYQWEAKKDYILTLGNTHAVRILLNGREIETNRTHQLLTNWIIDKSFLP